MNISIRHLEHFIAVAQELHFRRAAQLANVAQPALSRSVQTLESELGVQLLNRNNRNVRLTAAGKEFLAGCTGIVEAMHNTIAKSVRAGQTEIGGLNIGYTYISMCETLPKLLAEFQAQNPSITIEAVGLPSKDQIEQLHRNELDICFITGPISSYEVDTAPYLSHRFIAIANRDGPYADRTSISIEELSRENIMLRCELKASVFNQHVHEFFRTAGFEPNIEYLEQNHLGLLGKVALNKGVCVTTEGYGFVYAENLKKLTITGIDARLPTVMAWKKGVQSESVAAFRTFMLNRMNAKTGQQYSTESARLPEII